ncbi:MAG: tyrosine-type recombinase/integrase [Actinobacteria bacterium]|nr:tyrosine-type recombinase/integrase [Actinomycetota bacterium]
MPDKTEELPLFTASPVAGQTRLRPSSSLSAATQAWGEVLEADGRSIHTVKAFVGDLRLLARFLGSGVAIRTIGTHDLKNFLEWMLNRRGVPCSPKTYSRRVTSIKAFFRWLSEAGVLAEDPAASVAQQTVLSPLSEVLTPEEEQAALDAADILRRGPRPDARPYALLSLLLQTGIKKSECQGIHLNHVDLNSPEGPILFVRYGDVRKRYRERKLPLEGAWIPAFREYLAQYSPRRLEYLLEDIGEAAGLDKHLSFNMCRWTAALRDYSAGVDKDRIRQKLGLSKIQWREVGAKLDRLAARAQ